MSTSADRKPLFLRCRLDSAIDVNAVPVSVYKKCFYDYSLNRFGPTQANLRVSSYNNMTLLESCVLHHSSYTLTFNITDLEGSAFLSCTNTLSLALLQAADKLNGKLPSGANSYPATLTDMKCIPSVRKITVYHQFTACHNLIQ